MLYDKNPAYPHFSHLPFAKEPLKAIHVVQRIITTLFLVPIWLLANLPRERRPRKSWSLRQLIFVNFTRRIYRVTEVAGVTCQWGTRNPEQAPRPNELKETELEWAPPLKDVFRSGIVVDRFDSTSPFYRLHTDQNRAVCNTKVAQGNDERWRLAAVGRKISTESTRWMHRDAGRYGRTRGGYSGAGNHIKG